MIEKFRYHFGRISMASQGIDLKKAEEEAREEKIPLSLEQAKQLTEYIRKRFADTDSDLVATVTCEHCKEHFKITPEDCGRILEWIESSKPIETFCPHCKKFNSFSQDVVKPAFFDELRYRY
ncbi:MAG: hypothetical protein J6B87_06905 [Clostridia bacterium]|nr:hypothetical protein [Clostridia bacterium]